MKKAAIILALSMLSLGSARAVDSSTFRSVQAAKDVALNTNPETAFWRGASPVFMDSNNYGKPVPGYRTEVFSRWTKGNLYFLFVCPYQQLNLKPDPHPEHETFALWNWDVAEVFIGSNFKDIQFYKEFEISPQAEWVDLDINLHNPHHVDGWVWNSGFQVAARIDRQKKIWYGVMRIPFVAISPHAPRVGTIFRVNLFRSQGPAPHTRQITWQPPMTETFHTPEKFGTLKLVAGK